MTGRPARNRRRAASGDPAGAGVGREAGTGSARGSDRKARASSQDVAEAVQAAIERDQVEEIAMLAGRGIGLMCS